MSHRDVSADGAISWLAFRNPEEEGTTINVNLTFLASSWQCQYGRGCPGIFPKSAKKIAPDLGCCGDGFYVNGKQERTRVNVDVTKLEPGVDWDTDLHLEWVKNGWMEGKGDGKKSRVIDGACIFANRATGDSGKLGCAFLHMGNRLNEAKHDLGDNSEEHHNYMPTVCWMLPIKASYDAVGNMWVDAWSVNQWNGTDPGGSLDDDGTSNSFAHWWCVDSPDSYTNDKMLVKSMERELREVLGDKAYDYVYDYIVTHKAAIMPMVAEQLRTPNGRAMLPVTPVQTIKKQVGKRTVKKGHVWPGVTL